MVPSHLPLQDALVNAEIVAIKRAAGWVIVTEVVVVQVFASVTVQVTV